MQERKGGDTLSLFFVYVLAGLAIAMPVGVITIEMTKRGLQQGFMHGWAVGLGGMTIDLLLIIALYVGLAPILAIPYIQTPMWLIGAGFLMFLGYDSIKHSEQGIAAVGEKSKSAFLVSYRNGLIVALSPGNLIFWISVFGAVLADSYDAAEPTSFLIVGTGILTGILLHDIGLLTIVSLTRRVMSRTMIKWVSIIAGIILIGFAGYFLYEFAISIKELFETSRSD